MIQNQLRLKCFGVLITILYHYDYHIYTSTNYFNNNNINNTLMMKGTLLRHVALSAREKSRAAQMRTHILPPLPKLVNHNTRVRPLSPLSLVTSSVSTGLEHRKSIE